MKIYKPSKSKFSRRDNDNNEIDIGFDRKDSKLLAYETNYNAPVQILVRRKAGYLNKLEEKQFCSSCRTDLILLEKTQKLLCKSCGNAIPVMTNAPLLEINQQLRPFGSQMSNEYDRPFMVGLIEAEPNEPDWEVTSRSGDGRIQHVKLRRGLPPSAYRIRPTNVDDSS